VLIVRDFMPLLVAYLGGGVALVARPTSKLIRICAFVCVRASKPFD